MTVSITEYERLSVRNTRDLSRKQISKDDAVCLQSLIVDDVPIFKWGNRCLIAQHWVGVIDLPEFSVEILPKIAGMHSPDELRKILTRMLLIAHQANSSKKFRGSIAPQKDSLVEIIIDIFLLSLETYLDHGLLRSYQKVENNLQALKGKIVISKQINRNLLTPTRFVCKYSKYISDNPLNRFFKACLWEMKKRSRDSANIKRINQFLSLFDEILPVSPKQALVYRISFNSTNAIAEDAYRYGSLFLQNRLATLNAGTVPVNAMLFDMNDLYELFIYKACRNIWGHHVFYQKIGSHLLRNSGTGKKFINLRPDITIFDSSTKTIIDTKWKLPTKFVKESDIYQMNAYATAIPDVDRVFLMYPHTENDIQFVGDFSFVSNTGALCPLLIRTVDLSKCLNWKDFLAHIKSIVR